MLKKQTYKRELDPSSYVFFYLFKIDNVIVDAMKTLICDVIKKYCELYTILYFINLIKVRHVWTPLKRHFGASL